jgi:hypothetical protein
MVPRPAEVKKVQPQAIALDVDEFEEDADNTEPSGPPVVIETAPPILPGILIGTPAFAPPKHVNLGPALPAPALPATREIASSLPSQYELDSERKSSPPVAERRKELTKYVASAVGVAWFICTCAIGETALRSIIASMH